MELVQVVQANLNINNILCSALIKACEMGMLWSQALQLLRRQEQEGGKPDLLTISSTMSACGAAFQWATTLELLSQLPRRTLRPDVVTYGSAIAACASGTYWQQAFHVFDSMQNEVLPNVMTYSCLLDACVRGQCWQEAQAILCEMQKSRVQPTVMLHRQVFTAFEAACQWQRVLCLLYQLMHNPS
eukprot:symbB.v1.2.014687.t2/scaffold1073.1/size139849/8